MSLNRVGALRFRPSWRHVFRVLYLAAAFPAAAASLTPSAQGTVYCYQEWSFDDGSDSFVEQNATLRHDPNDRSLTVGEYGVWDSSYTTENSYVLFHVPGHTGHVDSATLTFTVAGDVYNDEYGETAFQLFASSVSISPSALQVAYSGAPTPDGRSLLSSLSSGSTYLREWIDHPGIYQFTLGGGALADLQAAEGSEFTIGLHGTGDSHEDYPDIKLSDVSLSFTSSVPEPASAALLACGLGLLAVRRRRRRR